MTRDIMWIFKVKFVLAKREDEWDTTDRAYIRYTAQ